MAFPMSIHPKNSEIVEIRSICSYLFSALAVEVVNNFPFRWKLFCPQGAGGGGVCEARTVQ